MDSSPWLSSTIHLICHYIDDWASLYGRERRWRSPARIQKTHGATRWFREDTWWCVASICFGWEVIHWFCRSLTKVYHTVNFSILNARSTSSIIRNGDMGAHESEFMLAFLLEKNPNVHGDWHSIIPFLGRISLARGTKFGGVWFNSGLLWLASWLVGRLVFVHALLWMLCLHGKDTMVCHFV